MRNDLTHITFLIDKSESMNVCQSEAQDGLNSLIKDQMKKDGDCTFTLIEFDSKYNIVHNGVGIKTVPDYTLIPSGMTNLTDAFGRGIDETGDYLASIPENERPGLVIFCILTDGEETVSPREYTQEDVKLKVLKQTNDFNWEFTFLGANQDAFSSASNFGVAECSTSSYDIENSSQAFLAVTGNVTRMRDSRASGQDIDNTYTAEETSAMNS